MAEPTFADYQESTWTESRSAECDVRRDDYRDERQQRPVCDVQHARHEVAESEDESATHGAILRRFCRGGQVGYFGLMVS